MRLRAQPWADEWAQDLQQLPGVPLPFALGPHPACSEVELKVGLIVEAWVHPTADKLYCEKIDLGEGAPREIASGLREHIALEDMQRRRVVVGAWAVRLRGRPRPASHQPTLLLVVQ